MKLVEKNYEYKATNQSFFYFNWKEKKKKKQERVNKTFYLSKKKEKETNKQKAYNEFINNTSKMGVVLAGQRPLSLYITLEKLITKFDKE